MVNPGYPAGRPMDVHWTIVCYLGDPADNDPADDDSSDEIQRFDLDFLGYIRSTFCEKS